MKTYRPDIDGLRALAVLAVVVFHAFPQALPGGFVGVDVFFVISGYLITGIIVREADSGAFSLSGFYARRVRRIFPALIVVLAATLMISSLLMVGDELANLQRHAWAGALFSSNLLLWREVGYFDLAAESKPLLHLWSLGVEEQFYLFWPFVVVYLRRFIPAVAAASFGLCVVLVALDHGSSAFYLPFTRLWELAAGAMLVGRNLKITPWLGLGVIAASSFLFSQRTPTWLMLVPVVATCLVIGGRSQILSNPALVYIGRISYPLYLWHWPLLVAGRMLGSGNELGALLAACVLSALTHRYIERRLPARALALGMVAFACSATLLNTNPPPSVAVNHQQPHLKWPYMNNPNCTERYQVPERFGRWFCILSKDAEPSVLLLGDSHANHLYPGIAAALPSSAVLSIGTCSPTPGIPNDPPDQEACIGERAEQQRTWIREAVLRPSIRMVIIASRWPSFDASGNAVDWETRHSSELQLPGPRTDLDKYIASIDRAIRQLGTRRIVLVLNGPRLPYDVRQCMRGAESCSTTLAYQEARRAEFNKHVRQMLRAHPTVAVYDPMPVFCNGGECRMFAQGVPLLRDSHHYSVAGSSLVGEDFARWAKAALPGMNGSH